MSSSFSRRGVVLIAVLGVLVVLALLATAFATLTRIERTTARNYLDEVRARLVAQSGIEAAVSNILASTSQGSLSDPAMTFWGSNVTETGSPDWACRLELAKNPSYAWEAEPIQNPLDPNVSPLIFSLDGKPLGISGKMDSGTYALNADVYRLRVEDTNSKIHVNDGLQAGPDGNVSLNLKRILNNLGSLVGVPLAGDKILASRPAIGYRSRIELEKVLGSADYLKIGPYLATVAWVDKNVVNPVPLSSQTLGAYPVPYNSSIGLYRYGRSRDMHGNMIDAPLVWAPEYASPTGVSHEVMALDELNAQWIEVTQRAPVNINGASREVLTSLIMGLRGWFLVERRKSNPANLGILTMYTFLLHEQYENAPGGRRGDEIGWLYSTGEFLGPDVAGSSGISAQAVADEILACRRKQPSPHMPGVDYAALWYGGPFRTWRQFYAFCDGLVSGGLIVDPRPIFHDFKCDANWNGAGNDWGNLSSMTSGSNTLVPSAIQPKFAAQAMADVLKANFNPNCTLNELNPDANLYLIVDKTDLIVNSTEFCFTPMGTFEIESEGLVIRTPGNADLLVAMEGSVVARKKIVCSVKVFDAYRETSQADFYPGKPGLRPSGCKMTNNNRTMEIGPEPDNGPAPKECRWSGWLQLSTIGGPWSGAANHVPGSLTATPEGPAEEGSALHAHFALDHRLDHHASGQRDWLPVLGDFRNNADRTESLKGPYGPTVGPVGKYRLARGWNAADTIAAPTYAAPGDLRLDGAYVERDSACMYVNNLDVFGSQGTIAYWIKPSFHPEMTGKPRTFFSMDRAETTQGMNVSALKRQLINGQWFFASQDGPALTASVNEGAFPIYSMGPWRPVSLIGGYSTAIGGIGMESESLNHRAHADTLKRDLLRHHGWVHVAYCWDFPQLRAHLWINGKLLAGSSDISVHAIQGFAQDYIANGVPLRLGEPSATMKATNQGTGDLNISRNWAADSTIDEFHMWKGKKLDTVESIFSRGRYHRPRPEFEGIFTSQAIPFSFGNPRVLPPPSSASLGGAGTGATGSTTANPIPSVRVLGAAWTWHPEKVRASDGQPQMFDWGTETDLKAEVALAFFVNDGLQGSWLTDDGGDWCPGVAFNSTETFTYRVRIRLPNATLQTVLLATPVIDDVTLYYTRGVEYLSYYVLEVAL